MRNQIKNIVRGAAILVGAAYAYALHRAGYQFDGFTRWVLGLAPGILVTAVLAFDLLLWKIPLVSRLTGKPRVYGTWLATLTPRQGSAIPPGGNWSPTGAVVIEQTFWSTSIHLYTGESKSSSTAVEFVGRNQSTNRRRLVYTYANDPKQEHQHRSSPHAGASEFEVVGLKPDTMNGTYWTGRLTAGDMTLRRLDKKTDYPDLAAVKAAADKANKTWP